MELSSEAFVNEKETTRYKVVSFFMQWKVILRKSIWNFCHRKKFLPTAQWSDCV